MEATSRTLYLDSIGGGLIIAQTKLNQVNSPTGRPFSPIRYIDPDTSPLYRDLIPKGARDA